MILHVFVSDVWQREGSHSKIVCKPEVTRPETNRSYEWAIPRHPRRKFIFPTIDFQGRNVSFREGTGMSMVLSTWIITLYKLVVSPISRLYTNLLTSYDHFHGSTLVVYFSQLKSWISLQGGCRRKTSQGGGR